MLDLDSITKNYRLEYKFVQDRLSSTLKINPLLLYDHEEKEYYKVSTKDQTDQIIYNALTTGDINILTLLAKLSNAISYMAFGLDTAPSRIYIISRHSNRKFRTDSYSEVFRFILENVFIDEIILN